MDFRLSAQQNQFQESLGRALGETLGQRGLHGFIDGEAGVDQAVWRLLVDFGATRCCLPEEYGGLGLEMIDLALIAEILGWHGAPGPFLGHVLAGLAIATGGDAEQKARWLPRLASGELVGSVALAEGDGQWLPESWALDPSPLLSGEKRNVLNGRDAGLIVVGLKGGQLAIVEVVDGHVTTVPMDGVDRTRRLDIVRFHEASVDRLRMRPDLAQTVVDAALVLVSADAFGGACRAVTMSVEYSKTREQFGVAIANFQALRHQLADMALQTEPCRGLYWYAAHAFDHLPAEASLAAALAKAHTAESYLRVARAAVEAHGGIGYTWEHGIHIWLKRAVFDWGWMGSPRKHRARAADLAGW
jgi:alkylation response protein AidB-like acyl-CoA dehydrogenase